MTRAAKDFVIPCINCTHKELFLLAYTDNLTQTYNRNMLEEFRKEIDINNKRLFVTIVDIDGLKEINDTYGHLSGDNCIKQIARMLSKRSEIIFRLGGDEFLLLNYNNPIYLNDFSMISYGSVERELYEPLTSAMHRADMLMYQEKRNKKSYKSLKNDLDTINYTMILSHTIKNDKELDAIIRDL